MALPARALFVAVALIAAQAADPLVSYRQKIDAYRLGGDAGDVDPSLAVSAVTSSAFTPADLEAGAMLHTDVCLRLARSGRGVDARAQLDAASALLRGAVSRDPSAGDYARRWRDAVVGLLDAFKATDLARDLDRAGREWWPESKATDAARKAFADGLTHEIAAAVAGRLSGTPPARAVAIAPEAVVPLHQAESDYGRALAADPQLMEASLHRGRVELLLWRDADAVAPLRAATASVNPAVRYLAFMFLGVVEERAGRLDAAIGQYRHALDAFRWGQSAPLALSHALMRAGRDADARDVLADHVVATRGRACDPLWTYLADPATDLGPTLDELRAEIWR